MNSPALKEVRPGPVAMLSTGTSRRPFGPATTQVARAAISAGTLSPPALPASDARPLHLVEPIRLAASTTPGQAGLAKNMIPSGRFAGMGPTSRVPSRAVASRTLSNT